MSSIRTLATVFVLSICMLAAAGEVRADPSGACCHPDGSCTEEFNFVCDGTPGDVYQGDFTVCANVTCPLPTTTTFPTTTTSTTTSTTSTTTSTTTTLLQTTTTTLFDITTTTSTTTSTDTTTTTIATGACCTFEGCTVETEFACEDMQGGFQGAGTSCTEPAICSVCGNGCVEAGETCDDANEDDTDGCAGCQEQRCYDCLEEQVPTESLTPSTCFGPGTMGPSVCTRIDSAECEICGDGTARWNEECDDGNTSNGDCCSSTCTYDTEGTPCPDETFCDGIETCDGAGACFDAETGPSCSQLDSDCLDGFCNLQTDTCDTQPVADGTPCGEAGGDCIVADSGACEDGICVGDATVMSPTCRWIIVAGSLTPPDFDDPNYTPVRLRSGRHSTVDANTCSDTAKLAGITTASHVALKPTGETMRFYGPPEVEDDIITGGGSVAANLYLFVPGTLVKQVPGGMMSAKMPTGIVDTTGGHELVQVCEDDKALLPAAAAAIDAMPADDALGVYKVPVGAGATIDITPETGVTVVDVQSLKVAHGAVLTLKGDASDVLVVRVTDGRMKFGYGASVVLDGLLPENVLFYSQWLQCRISPGVTGAGTVFCPQANRFKIGVGTNWTGTFLGGARELQVRLGATLTHKPFTGF